MDLTLLARATGAMGAAALGLWMTRRRRPPDYATPFGDLMGAVLAGLAVGRLVYLLGEGADILARPVDFLMVRGGITPVAAAAAALGFLAWTCRADRTARTDCLAPAVLWGLAAWEAGCWWQGACLGSPSGLWWAMTLPGSDLTRHPAGIYAALLLLFGALMLGRRTIPWQGGTAWAALGWASFVRAISSLWSVESWSDHTWWYLVGALAGLAGVVAAAWAEVKRAKDSPASPG